MSCTLKSGDCELIRSSFDSSFSKSAATSFPHFFDWPFWRSSSISSSCPPPNSSWIFLICCCRKYSRCWRSISSRVRIWMFCLISASCTSRFSIWIRRYIRSFSTSYFSNSIFSSTVKGKFELIKLTRISGLSRFFIANTVSGLSFSETSINLAVKSLQVSVRALNSSLSCSSLFSLIAVTVPFK